MGKSKKARKNRRWRKQAKRRREAAQHRPDSGGASSEVRAQAPLPSEPLPPVVSAEAMDSSDGDGDASEWVESGDDDEDRNSWDQRDKRFAYIESLMPAEGPGFGDMPPVFWPCSTCHHRGRRFAPPGLDQRLCEDNPHMRTVAVRTPQGTRYAVSSPVGPLFPVVCLICWEVGFIQV